MTTPRQQIQLRPYQLDAVAAIEGALATIRRMIIELATGGGKTLIFSEIIRRRGGRALVLCHRDELIQQAVNKLRLVIPGVFPGIVKAEINKIHQAITVASIQTISRPNRLRQFRRDIETIVIDECHHASSRAYRSVLDYFGAFKPGGPLVLGVTATPERADGIGLDCVFEEIVYRKPMLDLIMDGYLCDLRAMRIHLACDFSRVKTRGGDYVEGELAAVMEAANAPALVAQAVREHAADRKSLIFTPSVAMSYEIATLLGRDGFKAEAVDGTTDKGERDRINKRFYDGQTQILCNCATHTEGYDNPSVNAVIIARPTKSRSLFQQMIGRGTRTFPGKPDCLILDVTDNSDKHDLISVASLFGLPPRALKGKSLTEAMADEQTRSQRPAEREESGARLLMQGALVAREVDLFAPRQPLKWTDVTPGRYALSSGDGLLIVEHAGADQWRLVKSRNGAREMVADGLSLGYAQGMAEDIARKSGGARFSDPNAAWRSKEPSPRQLDRARRLRVPYRLGMTAGDVSDAITRAEASRAKAS